MTTDKHVFTVATPRGRLIRIIDDPPRGRLVEVGDLTACVPQMPWTPIMATAVFEYHVQRRFVSTGIARKWVGDLISKDRKEPAKILTQFLDWVDGLDLVAPEWERAS